MGGNPPGISFIRSIRGSGWTLSTYRYVVLIVTFIAYASYHVSRKPSSIVKSVLDPEPNRNSISFRPWPVGNVFVKEELLVMSDGVPIERNRGWAPFNGKDGRWKLGVIDVAFLSCYSVGMYVAGHLGDTLDLRLFLATGMVGSGSFVALFGMGYFFDVHVFWFYLAMQMVAGLLQSTGWPSVVAVTGNWFGKKKRGLIMGIWNAHTSVGNIAGSLLAAGVLQYGWGWSFILPGAFLFTSGIIVYFFLPAYPEEVGFPRLNDPSSEFVAEPTDEEAQKSEKCAEGNEVDGRNLANSGNRTSVGLLEACSIPGVIPFALCLFFAKMVAYTFLYWLPFYLSQTAIEGHYMSVKTAGNLSTLFDVGGIFGGVLAGYVSDKLKARATTAACFMYAAIPAMALYHRYGSTSEAVNILLMIIAGLFVNGPYALIATAVSADLGTHCSLKRNSRALATVTAIIDGTGSLGAALGPLLTGFLTSIGWDAVFMMLIISAFAAGLLLSQLVLIELREKVTKHLEGGHKNLTGLASNIPLLNEQG